MSKVAIITDNTAYIPKEYLEQYHITIVPQVLIWGDQSYEDGFTIQPDEFYQRLSTARIMPTTSQVAVLSMQTAFTSLLEQGYDVLGIFLSAKLSGTIQSAIQARSALGKGQSIFTSVSPVVVAHTGPGTLGLAYMTGL